MKKFVCILMMCALLLCGFAGCGKKLGDPSNDPTTETFPAAETFYYTYEPRPAYEGMPPVENKTLPEEEYRALVALLQACQWQGERYDCGHNAALHFGATVLRYCSDCGTLECEKGAENLSEEDQAWLEHLLAGGVACSGMGTWTDCMASIGKREPSPIRFPISTQLKDSFLMFLQTCEWKGEHSDCYGGNDYELDFGDVKIAYCSGCCNISNMAGGFEALLGARRVEFEALLWSALPAATSLSLPDSPIKEIALSSLPTGYVGELKEDQGIQEILVMLENLPLSSAVPKHYYMSAGRGEVIEITYEDGRVVRLSMSDDCIRMVGASVWMVTDAEAARAVEDRLFELMKSTSYPEG